MFNNVHGKVVQMMKSANSSLEAIFPSPSPALAWFPSPCGACKSSAPGLRGHPRCYDTLVLGAGDRNQSKSDYRHW